jgi:hypothetical protein
MTVWVGGDESRPTSQPRSFVASQTYIFCHVHLLPAFLSDQLYSIV